VFALLLITHILSNIFTGLTWITDSGNSILMIVHGHIAWCEITVSHGHNYANNCFR
jgi:hypothetical protein